MAKIEVESYPTLFHFFWVGQFLSSCTAYTREGICVFYMDEILSVGPFLTLFELWDLQFLFY